MATRWMVSRLWRGNFVHEMDGLEDLSGQLCPRDGCEDLAQKKKSGTPLDPPVGPPGPPPGLPRDPPATPLRPPWDPSGAPLGPPWGLPQKMHSPIRILIFRRDPGGEKKKKKKERKNERKRRKKNATTES